MKQFKSLIKRDVDINKWTLLLPLFVTIAIYAVLIFVQFKWGLSTENINFKMKGLNIPFIGLVGILLGDIWLSVMITNLCVIVMAPNALNDNIKHNSEIFYRCLPIPAWKTVISKLVVTTLFPLVITTIVALLNMTVAHLFLGNTSDISLGAFYHFIIATSMLALPYLLLFSSIFIFLSSIIKKKVFVRTVSVAIGINMIMKILESTTNINIGTLSEYFGAWLLNPTLTGPRIIDIQAIITNFNQVATLDSGLHEISNILAQSAFSLDGIVLFLASAGIITASIFTYKNRKLD